jgi:signal transduction histidine kinase
VRIFTQNNHLFLEVEDQGKGIAEDQQKRMERSGEMGVGFSGMRERLWQLGGTLHLQSGRSGTLVKAVLPMDSTASGSAA